MFFSFFGLKVLLSFCSIGSTTIEPVFPLRPWQPWQQFASSGLSCFDTGWEKALWASANSSDVPWLQRPRLWQNWRSLWDKTDKKQNGYILSISFACSSKLLVLLHSSFDMFRIPITSITPTPVFLWSQVVVNHIPITQLHTSCQSCQHHQRDRMRLGHGWFSGPGGWWTPQQEARTFARELGETRDEKQDLCRENMGIQDDSRFGVGTWVNFEWLGLTANHQQWQGKPSVCRRKNGFNQCKINESMMLGPLKIIVKVRIPLQLSSFSPFK